MVEGGGGRREGEGKIVSVRMKRKERITNSREYEWGGGARVTHKLKLRLGSRASGSAAGSTSMVLRAEMCLARG